MTDEELDKARAEEGVRLSAKGYGPNNAGLHESAEIAARLAREGWMPEDPLLPLAREVMIAAIQDRIIPIPDPINTSEWRALVQEGRADNCPDMRLVMMALTWSKTATSRARVPASSAASC